MNVKYNIAGNFRYKLCLYMYLIIHVCNATRYSACCAL